MTSTADWRGIYIIPPTPFRDDLSVDLDGLRNVVRMSLDCGAHGLVATANASETAFLSEAERREVIVATLGENDRKVPSVVGCSGPTAAIAIDHAKFAADAGADAVMAMPPTLSRPTENEIRDFYQRLGRATDLTIVIQNWTGMGGTPMSARLVTDIMRDNPTCRVVKEETEFSSQVMSEIRRLYPQALMQGGKSARMVVEEFHRGACGNMPATELPEVQVNIWNALAAGRHEEAMRLYAAILPFLMFEIGFGVVMFKAVLKRRGIIRSAAVRQTGLPRLDEASHAYLDGLLRRLSPLLDSRYPLPA